MTGIISYLSAAAIQCGFTVEDSKSKWKSIRDRYVREMKKVKDQRSGECIARGYFFTGKQHCLHKFFWGGPTCNEYLS